MWTARDGLALRPADAPLLTLARRAILAIVGCIALVLVTILYLRIVTAGTRSRHIFLTLRLVLLSIYSILELTRGPLHILYQLMLIVVVKLLDGLGTARDGRVRLRWRHRSRRV